MTSLTPAEVRSRIVAHLGLARWEGRGKRGALKTLDRLRCIQLDPLDVIGTNADLVVMARVKGAERGSVWKHLFPDHAFEHFAKERCILPAEAFPYYRERGHGAQTGWWRHSERQQRVAPELVASVLAEIRERGPVTARELTDHGAVKPMDWSGWTGTGKATSMALEILWTLCDVVVCGRTESGTKIYDIPERTLGSIVNEKPKEPFERWALRERVTAAGLLSRAGNASWSMLSGVRTSPLLDEMVEDGQLVDVTVEGSSRRYLSTPSFLERRAARYDNEIRILGPLDPLLWDRDLVRIAFGFDYVWEVYKPARQRKWGWYVCPLLHRDELVGRVDARIAGHRLVVRKLWIEADVDETSIREALERHAVACGAEEVKMPRRT
jgi:uncharacterized protein